MNARPVFLKWSLAVFVVLLPLLGYSIWDVIEAARLQSRMRTVTVPASRQMTDEEARAARYYIAAAALHAYGTPSSDPASIAENNATFRALRTGTGWTPAYIANARRRVATNREALEFVDRAAALPFASLFAGTEYAARTGTLMSITMWCEFRAVVLASDGDAEGAMASLYSEARLARAIYSDLTSGWTAWGFPSLTTITYVLEHTKPSRASIERLASSLAELDRDDMAERLIRFRASMLSTSRLPSWQPGALVTHNTVYALDGFSRLIAATEKPWPARLTEAMDVRVWPVPTLWARGGRGKTMLQGYVRSFAEEKQRVRCARLLLDGALDLIDPMSGTRLQPSQCRQ